MARIVPSVLRLAIATSVVACADASSPLATAPLASKESVASYNVQALPIPANALYGEASAINDAGIIAGWHTTGNVWSAVAWNAAGTQLLDLGKLPGYQSALAKGINASGTIVGYVLSAGFASSRAFRWTRTGGMQPLADLGGTGGIALSINSSGTAAGWAPACAPSRLWARIPKRTA